MPARPAPRPRRAFFYKWGIFGVLLPLLPIFGRLLSDWMEHGSLDLSLNRLFGDGELLVLATVIVAAGIGDLLFDARDTSEHTARRSLAVAVASSAALVVVVLSVLLFGLVTLDRQKQEDEVQASRDAAAARLEEAARAARNADVLRLQADQLSDESDSLQQQIEKLQAQAQGEANGSSGSGKAGVGPVVDALRATQTRLQAQSKDLRASSAGALQQAEAQREKAASATSEAVASSASVSATQRQAAVASLVMFFISLPVGAWCVAIPMRNYAKPGPPDIGVGVDPTGRSRASANGSTGKGERAISLPPPLRGT